MIAEDEVTEQVKSAMRVTLKTGRRVGAFMIIIGVVMAGVILAINRSYELIPFLTMLVTAGAGLITGLGMAKAWQAKSEEHV